MKQSGNQNLVTGLVVAVIILLGLLLFTLINKPKTTSTSISKVPAAVTLTPSPTPFESPATTPTPMLTPSPSGSNIRTINIEAGSFYFKPNEITVKKGETVRIVIQSASLMHDFVIDELGVKSDIVQNGNTGTVEFTATTPGTYQFYCGVANHRSQGQVGTLTVTD